jgi:hypothetical protein
MFLFEYSLIILKFSGKESSFLIFVSNGNGSGSAQAQDADLDPAK